MIPAIFLDRDGVIIENRESYIRSKYEVKFIPGALEALKRINRVTHKVVIITNQSVVGRGGITLDEAWRINEFIVAEIRRRGGRIDGVFMCPHAPEEGCACRKPAPGLLVEAAHSLGLDLKRSLMIGDALSDLLAAKAAGVPRLALLRTGRGEAQEALASGTKSLDYGYYSDLEEALQDLVP